MQRAVFLDKDGTLIENVPYNVDPARVVLYRDVPKALKILAEMGFKLIVISNQAGVAKGYFNYSDLENVWNRLQELLEPHKIHFDAFYACPHHVDGIVGEYAIACDCRKPAPGMLLKAAHEHDIDLASSWMVGDILHDIEAGNRAGCRTILAHTGGETEWVFNDYRIPLHTVRRFWDAVAQIQHYEKVQTMLVQKGKLYEWRSR
jgi:HAD superfamily hydrolase (TIGR01662 family)